MLSGLPIPKDIALPPETILVNITPQETRGMKLRKKQYLRAAHRGNSEHSLVGNIYLRVRRVAWDAGARLSTSTLNARRFYTSSDVLEQRRNPEETQRIEHMLFEGGSLFWCRSSKT